MYGQDEALTGNFGDRIAPGTYKTQITDAQVKSGNWGVGIEFMLTLLDGEQAGAVHKEFIIVQHDKEIAGKIGRSKLADLRFAVGDLSVAQTETQILPKVLMKSCYVGFKLGKDKDGNPETRFFTAWNKEKECRSKHAFPTVLGATGEVPALKSKTSAGKGYGVDLDSDVPF